VRAVRLTPRYGVDPIVRIESSLDDVGALLVRQRSRLTDLLATLDKEQWTSPSRCDAWTVQDVIAHLIGTNQFWTISIAAGLAGTPTRILAEFDPVATPAQMVDAARSRSINETLDQFVDTNAALAAAVEGLDTDSWSVLAEAPPGHIALHAVALHALWDSWVHERDVAIPLGIDAAVVADEIVACLRYAAALGPALLVSTGSMREAILTVDAVDPDTCFSVHVGPHVVVRDGGGPPDATILAGPSVELLEALSFRAPLPGAFPESGRWFMSGLAAAFDTVA
jgi:uncharacterized protein (TIGR03083 family)